MKNEITVFNNAEFGEVRTIMCDGVPWFVALDVSKILEYRNGSRDIQRHTDEEDRKVINIYTKGQNRKSLIINKSGLFSLILNSKLPTAKKFKRWVTNEVLPSLEENGAYIMNQENLSDEDLIARALIAANKIIAENKNKIKQLEPKAEFADLLTGSKGSIMIGEFAAILAKENIMLYDKRINRDSLFKWLRERNYLIKRKDLWNVPKKKYIERGLFEVEERIGNSGIFEDKVYTITLITPLGQRTIYERIKKEN